MSITAPNFLHREIGVAMARAGKHIWIEKPVGLSTEDAQAVADAADAAGVQGAVGFNYRNAPAVSAARELIAAGEIGAVTHVRVRFFSDYAAHPEGALTWRYEKERGGSGVLGDLASHGVDLAQYLLGDITSLVADTAIFVPERAKPTGATTAHARATGGELGAVENDDYASALVRFASGAHGGWRPAELRSASRTPMASRSTVRRARCSGTSAGWANWACRPAPDIRTSRCPPSTSARAPASMRLSSRARPTPWVTTT